MSTGSNNLLKNRSMRQWGSFALKQCEFIT